jgi:hypothetical protein
MPNKEFLEKYPLYRKFTVEIPYDLDDIEEVNIKLACEICGSNQTFNMETDYSSITAFFNNNSSGQIVLIRYLCAHCKRFRRIFIVRIGKNRNHLEKVGQYPPWNIFVEPNLQKILGNYQTFFSHGLICESQGYGIAANIYYRRVIEGVIDDLLNMILLIMKGVEKQDYEVALKETKNSKHAQEKMAIVKDLLPKSLLPERFNPLKTLHGLLSEGIHEKDDDECLKDAQIIREIIIYLVNQISKEDIDQKEFTENMKKLLEKKKRAKLKQNEQKNINSSKIISKSKIIKLFTQFIKIFDVDSILTKGEAISTLREIGKPNFLKHLNLDFVDQNNMVILRNADWELRFFSPSIIKPYNFIIIKHNLKVNNVYRHKFGDSGNDAIRVQFLFHIAY